MSKRNQRGPAIIYKIVNTKNDRFYVGVTTRPLELRLKEHFYTASHRKLNGHFQRAIRKHGPECFSIHKLFTCRTLGEAKTREIEVIAALKPAYNSTKGGDGQLGRKFSKEALRRIGAAHLGKARHNKPHSAATKAKLSEIARSLEAKLIFSLYAHMGPKAMSKVVVCAETGQHFPSASAAARSFGVSKSAVIELCNGNPRRKTVAGHVFRYEG